MFSFADASGRRTALVSFRNCLYLLPLGLLAHNCKFQDSTIIPASKTLFMLLLNFLF